MIYSAGLKSCAIFFSFPLFAENFNPAFRKEKGDVPTFYRLSWEIKRGSSFVPASSPKGFF